MLGRRREPSTVRPNALVAAATRIRLDDKKLAARQSGKRQAWQEEAWAYFDEVPELKYSVWFLGNAVAKLRVYAATVPPKAEAGTDPVPVEDELADLPPDLVASAQEEMRRLQSTQGGVSSMLRRLNMNLEVAAEGYLVGLGERQGDPVTRKGGRPEEWMIRSVSEVDVKQGVYFVKESPDDAKGTPLDPELDTCIRLWQEHPRWAGLADNAMRGVLGECKVLQVLSQQVMAHAMRAASAGFFTMPNELSFGAADPTEPEDGEAAVADPLLEFFARILVNPIDDPSDPATVQPGIIRGPAEFLHPDFLRRIPMWDKDMDASLEERIKARIDRLARGLNLPVEVVMGHQATTYANAEQVDQDTFEDHLEPRCTLIADALTVGYLRPNLLDAGYAPELVDRIRVWYDASALIAQPDTEKNADEAHKKFVISDAAYRRAKGYTEDDAPDPLEVLIRAGLQRGILTADLTSALIVALADEAGVDLPAAPAELQPAQAVAGDAAATNLAELAALLLTASARRRPATRANAVPARAALTAATRGTPDFGRQLADVDRELRTRLVVAANDAMARALEKAGNRMRSKANGQREVLRDVPARMVAATLGPTLALRAASTDDALEGAWDELERQFMEWGAQAQASALDVASLVASGLTTAERASLGLRQADDLAQAWAWMRDALQALAGVRMFDPDPAAPDLGEFDPTLRVPTGLVRQAIARAGGATGLVTNGQGGAYITMTDAGTRPAGGIGTGELLRGVLRDHGVGTEGYRWVYGPAFRKNPFDPHRQLDGVTFVNFDDEVLANTDGWPETAYYMPGDHSGCICDVEPILLPPDEVS